MLESCLTHAQVEVPCFRVCLSLEFVGSSEYRDVCVKLLHVFFFFFFALRRQIPFPNKELGAWMTNRRNRQLLDAIVRGSVQQDAASADLIQDCTSVNLATQQFLDGQYFQVRPFSFCAALTQRPACQSKENSPKQSSFSRC